MIHRIQKKMEPLCFSYIFINRAPI